MLGDLKSSLGKPQSYNRKRMRQCGAMRGTTFFSAQKPLVRKSVHSACLYVICPDVRFHYGLQQGGAEAKMREKLRQGEVTCVMLGMGPIN